MALKEFGKSLVGMSDQLEREPAYAEACQAVNDQYSKVYDAKVMMDDMYAVAIAVRNNYKKHNSSTSGLDSLNPKPHPAITIPDPVTPRWRCKCNGILSGAGEVLESLLTCLETYYTPNEAHSDHRIVCGGDNDPNPSVSGCGHSYYSCQEDNVKKHQVKYCDNYIAWHPGGFSLAKREGFCGEPFRDCRDSTSRSGVHNYEPV